MACLENFRSDRRLAVAVLFIAFVLETLVSAFLMPTLPRVLQEFYCNYSDTQGEENSSNKFEAVYINFTTGFDDRKRLECDDDVISRHIGMISGASPLSVLILSPLLSYFVRKVGNGVAFYVGSLVEILGLLFFVTVYDEWGIWIGLVIHFVGANLSTIAGLALLATRFEQEGDRTKAFAQAYLGLTVGFLIGYPCGSLLYEWTGRHVPYLLIMGLCFLDMLLRCLVSENDSSVSVTSERRSLKSYSSVISDGYVLITALLTFVAYYVSDVTIVSIPKRLIDTSGARQWQIGFLFTIATAFELIVQLAAVKLVKLPIVRFWVIFVSFLFSTAALAMYPFMTNNVWLAAIPQTLIRFGEGLYGAMMPSLLADIADRRSVDYSQTYTIFVVSYNIAYSSAGPLAAYLITIIGFFCTYLSVAMVTLLCTFLSLAVKDVKTKEIDGSDSHLTEKTLLNGHIEK